MFSEMSGGPVCAAPECRVTCQLPVRAEHQPVFGSLSMCSEGCVNVELTCLWPPLSS